MKDTRALRAWASLAGLLFVAMWIVGNILLFGGAPDSGSSPSKMAAYFGDSGNRDQMNIGWIIAGLGLFFFLWFVAALRETVRGIEGRDTGAQILSSVVSIGGTAYAAVSMAAIGLSVGVRTMSDDTYHHQVYNGVIHAADDGTYVMHATGTAALAAMIFAFSIAVLGSRTLPRWLGWFGILAGVAALVSLVFLPMFIWLLWIVVASLLLFAHTRRAELNAQASTA